jgi:hypothetical protein
VLCPVLPAHSTNAPQACQTDAIDIVTLQAPPCKTLPPALLDVLAEAKTSVLIYHPPAAARRLGLLPEETATEATAGGAPAPALEDAAVEGGDVAGREEGCGAAAPGSGGGGGGSGGGASPEKDLGSAAGAGDTDDLAVTVS